MRRRRDAVNVRSHRRGGRRRRLTLAPWIVISTVSVLLLSGVSAGYAWLAYSGCSGEEVRVKVAASPTVARILDNLGRRWADTQPSVNGHCASVEIISKNSAHVAEALGPGWDPRRDGPRPHVWVPDSTAWLKLASAREEAARFIPDRQPSLARTPAVIAMPMPMAKAVGWPKAKMSWQRFGVELAGERGWAELGHPEWGDFKIGMANPLVSTAGLHALMAIADRDDDGRITSQERNPLVDLSRAMKVYAEDTPKIIGDLTKRDPEGEKKVLSYLSAFPILEHDLWEYNDSQPKVPLAAVYPTDGAADADYPYLTLDAPWSDAQHRNVATQFLAYARGAEGRQTFLDNAFRDSNRKPGKGLTSGNGTQPRLRTIPRAVLAPESVSVTTGAWTASAEPSNVLFALDVSASMNAPVRGADGNRLQLAQQALSEAVGLFNDQSRVGLWGFSSQLGGDSDHTELVSMGPLGDLLGSHTRRDALDADLNAIAAGGPDSSGVNDTALAAHQNVGDNYVKDTSNLVVLITDGRDDGAGVSLPEATARLADSRDASQPTQLIAIGYGPDADMEALTQLAEATGGRAYHAEHETDINSTLLTALMRA